MTPFELAYVCAEPFLPPLYGSVRRRLLGIAGGNRAVRILDVGGRKSNYTIGVPAQVYITDLPRASTVQETLHLGVNHAVIRQVSRRRSNVRSIWFDDMTRSSVRDGSLDCIVAVEVLEHVEEDGRFVEETRRALRPGGVFLMTTPNAESVRNTNPDHKRHYTRAQLAALLAGSFGEVHVDYAVRGGRFHDWGLLSWTPAHPLQTIQSMVGNLVNSLQSSSVAVTRQASGTGHLIALARKI